MESSRIPNRHQVASSTPVTERSAFHIAGGLVGLLTGPMTLPGTARPQPAVERRRSRRVQELEQQAAVEPSLSVDCCSSDTDGSVTASPLRRTRRRRAEATNAEARLPKSAKIGIAGQSYTLSNPYQRVGRSVSGVTVVEGSLKDPAHVSSPVTGLRQAVRRKSILESLDVQSGGDGTQVTASATSAAAAAPAGAFAAACAQPDANDEHDCVICTMPILAVERAYLVSSGRSAAAAASSRARCTTASTGTNSGTLQSSTLGSTGMGKTASLRQLADGSVTVCDHVFHMGCIAKWASISASCPLCKAAFQGIFDSATGVMTRVEPPDPDLRDADGDDGLPFLDSVVCLECGSNDNEHVLLLCDGDCGRAAHTYCVGLGEVPHGDWFCPRCGDAGAVEARRNGAGRNRQGHELGDFLVDDEDEMEDQNIRWNREGVRSRTHRGYCSGGGLAADEDEDDEDADDLEEDADEAYVGRGMLQDAPYSLGQPFRSRRTRAHTAEARRLAAIAAIDRQQPLLQVIGSASRCMPGRAVEVRHTTRARSASTRDASARAVAGQTGRAGLQRDLARQRMLRRSQGAEDGFNRRRDEIGLPGGVSGRLHQVLQQRREWRARTATATASQLAASARATVRDAEMLTARARESAARAADAARRRGTGPPLALSAGTDDLWSTVIPARPKRTATAAVSLSSLAGVGQPMAGLLPRPSLLLSPTKLQATALTSYAGAPPPMATGDTAEVRAGQLPVSTPPRIGLAGLDTKEASSPIQLTASAALAHVSSTSASAAALVSSSSSSSSTPAAAVPQFRDALQFWLTAAGDLKTALQITKASAVMSISESASHMLRLVCSRCNDEVAPGDLASGIVCRASQDLARAATGAARNRALTAAAVDWLGTDMFWQRLAGLLQWRAQTRDVRGLAVGQGGAAFSDAAAQDVMRAAQACAALAHAAAGDSLLSNARPVGAAPSAELVGLERVLRAVSAAASHHFSWSGPLPPSRPCRLLAEQLRASLLRLGIITLPAAPSAASIRTEHRDRPSKRERWQRLAETAAQPLHPREAAPSLECSMSEAHELQTGGLPRPVPLAGRSHAPNQATLATSRDGNVLPSSRQCWEALKAAIRPVFLARHISKQEYGAATKIPFRVIQKWLSLSKTERADMTGRADSRMLSPVSLQTAVARALLAAGKAHVSEAATSPSAAIMLPAEVAQDLTRAITAIFVK